MGYGEAALSLDKKNSLERVARDPRYAFGLRLSVSEDAFTEAFPLLYDKGARVFQILIPSGPRIASVFSMLSRFVSRIPQEVHLYAVAPYQSGMATSDGGLRRRCMDSLTDSMALCADFGVRGCGVRVGRMGRLSTREQGFQNAVSFLEGWAPFAGAVPLLIENEGGSPGDAVFVYRLVKRLAHGRIRGCFNPDSALSGGFDVEDEGRRGKILEGSGLCYQRMAEGRLKGETRSAIAGECLKRGIPVILDPVSPELFFDEVRLIARFLTGESF